MTPTGQHFLSAIESDAAALAAAARKGLEADVPTCPGWTIQDLVLHLGRIHREKEQTIRENLTGDDFNLESPVGDLVDWFVEGVGLMLTAFRSKHPSHPSWTWYEPDQTVGFWYRRMAHETLIHRVDAELAHGTHGPVDDEIAEDGVDEALAIYIEGYPPWAKLDSDDRLIRLSTPARSWLLRTGTYSGTTRSGRQLEKIPTVTIEPERSDWDCEISGSPAALDLWLWGRSAVDDLEVSGDAALADYLRQVAAKST